MSTEKILYRNDNLHGHGADIHFAWQTGGSAALLATTGSDGTVAILNRSGQLQQRLVLPANSASSGGGGSVCAGFAWDPDGDLLAVISTGSAQLMLWDANTQQQHTIDVGLRDALTCVCWARGSAAASTTMTAAPTTAAAATTTAPPMLAVGTARGNVAIYNHQTARRTPILGKHTKRITCAAWSAGAQILAMASDDRTLSLSSASGDSLRTVALRDAPADMQFAAMKTDGGAASSAGLSGSGGGGGIEGGIVSAASSAMVQVENTVSLILGRRTLYLFHLPEPDGPTELGFQAKYGALIQHRWFGDGYILLGFANGYAVAISTHAREVGQELWQVRNHRDQLTAVAVSPLSLGMLASAGADGTVKVHAIDNLKETVSIVTLPGGDAAAAAGGSQGIRSVEWSTDGQLMAVSTQQGALFVYVTQLPKLFAVTGARVAMLTSLAEVTLYPDVRSTGPPAPAMNKLMPLSASGAEATTTSSSAAAARPAHVVQLAIEPTFVALGPRHLACGMNNHVWFYELAGGRASAGDVPPMLLGDREYLAEITAVHLNAQWCAVLCGGQVMLHAIESTATTTAPETTTTTTRKPQVFPGGVPGLPTDSVITCLSLTNEFLVFATDLGNVVLFALDSWMPVVRWRHTMGIKRMFSDADGTKLVLIDDHNDGHVFVPATEDLAHIADFPKTCTGVLWDGLQANAFIVCAERHCSTFVYVKHSVHGRHIVQVPPVTALLSGQQAVVLSDGDLILTSPNGNGRLSAIRLATHRTPAVNQRQLQHHQRTAAADDDDAAVRKGTTDDAEEAPDELGTMLLLRRHSDAWSLCRTLNSAADWQRLGRAALADLDVSLALRAYRQAASCSSNAQPKSANGVGDQQASAAEQSAEDCSLAMVFALQDVQHIEDSAYIAGMCSLLLDQTDRAKAHFARSCRPLEALELCRDLLQWEQAMSLAETLAPAELPAIALEYAQQLEDSGQYGEALLQYERACPPNADDANGDRQAAAEEGPSPQRRRRRCQAGMARTSIANGDAQHGAQLALGLFAAGECDGSLLVDCAEALLRHHGSTLRDVAAQLLERAGNWERACQLYVEQQQWQRVGELLPHCAPGAAKLHAAYARAMEQAGDYAAAVRAYTAAGDSEACVRVHLERLSDPHAAGEIVLSTRSVEGGRQLAEFYQKIGDTEQALQFLVLCGSLAEALRLARRHTKMERYAELLDGAGTSVSGGGAPAGAVTTADWRAVAEHFEAERHSLLAGKYWCRAGECGRALRLLLRAAQARLEDEAAALQLAIECVARAQDDRLAEQLIGFLLGDGGDGEVEGRGGGGGGGATTTGAVGVPRDPKYLFRLYMARGQLREAAKTAVIVAQQEQQSGNYRVAHGMLLGMCQELRRNGLPVGAEMREQLVLLHRYALVRLHVKLGEHERAARLLCEVAQSIGQFPAHIVPILTSTVIECQRAGLAAAAYRHAAQLMRSEYRSQIDAKYAKKIEAIVRKAPRDIKDAAAAAAAGKETAEAVASAATTAAASSQSWSPCPVCEEPLATMRTVCQHCRSTVPICIATGEHITRDDLSACPECDFPCFRAPMQSILDMTNQCPMCAEIVDSNRLAEAVEPTVYVNLIT